MLVRLVLYSSIDRASAPRNKPAQWWRNGVEAHPSHRVMSSSITRGPDATTSMRALFEEGSRKCGPRYRAHHRESKIATAARNENARPVKIAIVACSKGCLMTEQIMCGVYASDASPIEVHHEMLSRSLSCAAKNKYKNNARSIGGAPRKQHRRGREIMACWQLERGVAISRNVSCAGCMK